MRGRGHRTSSTATNCVGLHRLDRADKVEGVHARVDGTVIQLLLVTDADDADIPAGLFSAETGR